MNKKESMYASIKEHGENVDKIFNTGLDPIALCKRLRRLENKAHQLALDYCNGTNDVNTDNWDAKCAPILASVRKVLGIKNQYPMSPDDSWPIFLNGDARGYALKIHDSYVSEHSLDIYKDWGGYGILAPDFNA